MVRKIAASVLVIISLILMVFYMASERYYNLDYLGQGKLNSVTFIDNSCYTSICDEGFRELTITDPDQLKTLQSVFFNKIRDITHVTKEGGNMRFIFHFEKSNIQFSAGIRSGFKSGLIYYTYQRAVYHMYKEDLKFLNTLFTIKY